MGTLSLGKKGAAAAQTVPDPLDMPEEKPEFDPRAHYGEVGGVQGVKYVQGDNYFKPNGDFHSVAPPEARMKPLTKEQEADRQRRLNKDRKLFGTKLAQAMHDRNLPQNIVEAEKENARARAVETLSE